IRAALDGVCGIVAPDTVDTPDREDVGTVDDRDRYRRHDEYRLGTGLGLGTAALSCGAGKRQCAGGDHGPAIERSHRRFPLRLLVGSSAYLPARLTPGKMVSGTRLGHEKGPRWRGPFVFRL